jgi:hypothetical protein
MLTHPSVHTLHILHLNFIGHIFSPEYQITFVHCSVAHWGSVLASLATRHSANTPVTEFHSYLLYVVIVSSAHTFVPDTVTDVCTVFETFLLLYCTSYHDGFMFTLMLL